MADTNTDTEALYGENERLRESLQACDAKLNQKETEIRILKREILEYTRMIEERDKSLARYQDSTSWKITSPLRGIKNVMRQVIAGLSLIKKLPKGIRSIRNHGFAVTFQRAKNRLGTRFAVPETGYSLTPRERTRQEQCRFSQNICFSVLVPLYNTPPQFLREMIDSVLAQTYCNWELCLVDASDAQDDVVEETCKCYAKSVERIRYQRLANNRGIAHNTNEAAVLAHGDYLVLLDHDDILHPSALFELITTIEATGADFIYTDECSFKVHPQDAFLAHFKSDFAPDTLRSYNYICHLTAFSRALFTRVGPFNPEMDGSQDYDMILRLTEQAQHIAHIPKILYYWRAHEASVASGVEAKAYAIDAARQAISEHLLRVGLKGNVINGSIPTVYKTNYELDGMPLVSIIIPNKDHIDDLDTCLTSVFDKTTYPNYEVIIVENNSEDSATFDYYKTLPALLLSHAGQRAAAGSKGEGEPSGQVQTWCACPQDIRVLTYAASFNFSTINNFAVKEAKGDYLLFLNNDTQVVTSNWIEEMLMFAQRPDVGAVGAKLCYPDDTIQHAGVILGIGGVAGHAHRNFKASEFGYMSKLHIAQNVSAITAACLLVRKATFDQVDGFDEGYRIAFNDIDFCMQLREAGYLNVFTPYAKLYHYESKSRGYEDSPEKQRRFLSEIQRFQSRWHTELEAGDPYYNPNLTLIREDFSPATPSEKRGLRID
jgi:GT2 family glycosyltransferase